MTRRPSLLYEDALSQERALLHAASDAQRDAVVAHSSDLVIYFETDGTIVWASPATQFLFGTAVDSLVGRNGMELIHPDDQEEAFAAFASIGGVGDTVRCEFRVVADDGSIHWIEETATNLVDDPHVGYVVANLNNITARKRDENSIRLQNRLLDAAGQAIVAVDMQGNVFYWNAAATDVYGWTADEARGQPAAKMCAPADGWAYKAVEVAEHVIAGRAWSGDFVITRKDGTEVPVFVADTPVFDDDVQIGIIAVSFDITERRRQERAQAQLSAIVTSSSDAIFSTDLSGIVLTWNEAAEKLYGYSADAMIGHDISITVPTERGFTWDERIGIVRAGGSTVLDTVRRRADGVEVDVSVSVSPMRDGAGNAIGASASVRDITDRKKLERDLVRLATHDALTGLANRSVLLAALGDAVAAPASASADSEVGVLLFDVDRFKLVNDSLGHDRGDQLLVAIAEAVRETIEPDDRAARFGDDSFAVLRPRLETPDTLLRLAARLRDRLNRGVTVEADRYFPTISVGMVIAKAGDTEITVLRDAETAMYRAKEKGRDRAEWFDPSLRRNVLTGFEVERDLRQGISHDELFLEFQPVLDLETGEVASCEALIRWNHPARGRLAPDDFIPVAEQTGLIVSVGRWVLRHALLVARTWPDEVLLAVNLSPRELAEPDLIAFVRGALAEIDVTASRLVFEITETAVVEDPTAAARAISALRTLGVRVVIDDFGTGYTSLSFLRDYQIDGLKIDRSYVTDLAHGSTAIVDAMIRMSAALGLQVIAEGIETREQLAQLRTLGCRYIQGFLVGQPVAPERLPFMQP
jgi:diguanylate cyclase (GGDEF)-like protein/PAS domain S-box-containing protein